MNTGDIKVGIYLSTFGWRVVWNSFVPDLFFATAADAAEQLQKYIDGREVASLPSTDFADAFEALTGTRP